MHRPPGGRRTAPRRPRFHRRPPAPASGFLPLLAAMVAGLAAAAPAAAQDLPGVRRAPRPDWVAPVAFDPEVQVPQEWLTGGVHDLLMDLQIRGGAGPEEHHYHTARLVWNQQGVELASQVAVGFNPAFEEVILHEVLVHRGGEALPRLDLSLARVVEPESRRDQQIFDGTRSLLLFLPDVRVGDVVEARYTVRGSNPAFQGRFATAFYTAQTAPVEHLSCRVRVPQEVPLRWKHHRGDQAPEVRDRDGDREYLWQFRQVAPVVMEEGLPDWFDPLPWVQVSTYRSWQEVAEWGEALFRLPPRMPAAIAAEVRRIQAAHPRREDQLLAALRFVQDEVRYLGLMFGAGSFRPHPVAEVLERRYGDCKDKTMLTLALWRGLGVRAEPALVNTTLRGRVRDLLPSHFAFDHVIVRAEVGGRVLWLDPTLSRQGGTLRSVAAPDLGAALVLGGDGPVCQVIPAPTPAQGGVQVVRTLDVRAGVDPVPFSVETTYRGVDADLVRRELHRASTHELQGMYLSFYQSAWPSIRPAGPLLVEDDRRGNELCIVEEYAIPDFWRHHDRRQERGDVPALEVSMLVPGDLAGPRSMPLALPTTAMDCTTLLRLDEGWQLESEEAQVDTPYLRAAFTAHLDHGWLELHHALEPRADHIPAEQCGARLAELASFRESLQYQLLRHRRGQGFQEEIADR